MHRKFRQNTNEALKALVIGKSKLSDTSFANLFLKSDDQLNNGHQSHHHTSLTIHEHEMHTAVSEHLVNTYEIVS